jgi:NADH dehydrogenase
MQTCEPEFSETLSRILSEKGIALMTDARVSSFRETDDSGVEVCLQDGSILPCDFAVLATGVQLNTNLAEAAGIDTNQFGIVTDDCQRTNFGNIFAAGDCAAKRSMVTGQPTRGEFGTNAVFMAKIVAKQILGQEVGFPGVINASVTKVFDWGIGSAGLTERMARNAGLDVVTGQSRVLDKYPMIEGVNRIQTKLVFERQSGQLLGGTVMRRGDTVAANIDFLSLAIQMKAGIDDLLVHQYATHPELAAKPSDNQFVFAAEDAAKARGLQMSTV